MYSELGLLKQIIVAKRNFRKSTSIQIPIHLVNQLISQSLKFHFRLNVDFFSCWNGQEVGKRSVTISFFTSLCRISSSCTDQAFLSLSLLFQVGTQGGCDSIDLSLLHTQFSLLTSRSLSLPFTLTGGGPIGNLLTLSTCFKYCLTQSVPNSPHDISIH